jgi:acyl-CoA thioesterase I
MLKTILYLSVTVLTFTSFMSQNKETIRYFALGDSYTIGTGAKINENWPTLLTKHLNGAGIKTELIGNPSRNGFSTQNLIDYELPEFDKSNANFVTLLIGVNDWVRGIDSKTFHKNLSFIIDHVLSKLSDKKNLILVTIPDFGVTPEGKNYGNGRNISNGIGEFNDIIREVAKKHNLGCVDIFEISKQMKDDPELVANDGLHPSAKEYAVWEKLIFPEAKKLLEK